MKYKLATLAILGCFSSGGFCTLNNVCINYPGTIICENGKIENIAGTYGSVLMDNVEVTNKVNGNIGTINIKHSKVNQVNGNIGNFIATDSTFPGKIKGNIGAIQLKTSSINEIDAHASDVYLYNSKVEKIVISSKEKRIKVLLINKSIINRDIYFPDNSGEVCIDDSSELKGNIVNGKIVRGNC